MIDTITILGGRGRADAPEPVQRIDLRMGDVIRTTRKHPCGGDTWLVDRLGADIGLRCETCGRHLLIERPAVERRVTGFVRRGDPVLSAAVAPQRP